MAFVGPPAEGDALRERLAGEPLEEGEREPLVAAVDDVVGPARQQVKLGRCRRGSPCERPSPCARWPTTG